MKENFWVNAPIAMLVILFSFLVAWFLREGKIQKKIITIRNILGSEGQDNFIENEPLVMSKDALPQQNEGPNQHDKKFPSIKVYSYGSDCQLAPKTKGIWC